MPEAWLRVGWLGLSVSGWGLSIIGLLRVASAVRPSSEEPRLARRANGYLDVLRRHDGFVTVCLVALSATAFLADAHTWFIALLCGVLAITYATQEVRTGNRELRRRKNQDLDTLARGKLARAAALVFFDWLGYFSTCGSVGAVFALVLHGFR